MNFRRQLLSSLILLSVFGLASCSSWRERPQENPHPQYYLTLKGHIAKPLQNKVRLRFIQAYVGSNPKCAAESDPISGIKENPARSFTHLAELDANGNYEIKVPLDKYLPGYCHWQSYDMGITLTNQEYHYESDGYGFINYNDKQSASTYLANPKIYNYLCPINVDNTEAGDNCDISLVPSASMLPIYFKTNHSHQLIVSVNYKDK